jgi:hypothetical protein
MENRIMKKFFAIIILTIFVLSTMGSVSPQISSYIKSWTGDQIYSSNSLPAPPEMKTDSNLANN